MADPPIAVWVANIRKAEAALRGIRRNRGKTMATTRAKQHHVNIRAHFNIGLMHAGRENLVGLLTEEADLAWRLMGEDARPELRARLRDVRRQIRKELA